MIRKNNFPTEIDEFHSQKYSKNDTFYKKL